MEYNHILRQSLGFFPTPLIELSRLSKALDGPTIFMKRDDNTGLALGGNKTRKLEFIMGDALAQGADCVITAGAAQSNHCRQTAAAAASLGLECHLVLGGEEPEQTSGNLLLDKIFGSHIHWAGANRKGEDIPKIVEQLTKQGKKPYVIPYGGSNELGALAFVEAFKELESQRESMDVLFTHIVFASSSGATQAGLMLGKKILNSPAQIVGINKTSVETLAKSVLKEKLTWVPAAVKGIIPNATFDLNTRILTATVTLPREGLSSIMPVLKLGVITVPDLPPLLTAQSSAQLVPLSVKLGQ